MRYLKMWHFVIASLVLIPIFITVVVISYMMPTTQKYKMLAALKDIADTTVNWGEEIKNANNQRTIR